MKNNNVKGLIALAVVVVVAFGVIMGTKAMTKNNNGTGNAEVAQAGAAEEMSVEGFDGIKSASKLLAEDGSVAGYEVEVVTNGYGGEVTLKVTFDAAGANVTNVAVLEQTETEGVGSKITEADFLGQFANVAAPVYVEGMEVPTVEVATEGLQDGTYTVEGEEYNGYADVMTMTIKDGKVVEVIWDALDADGNGKRVLSDNGEYVMTEDGLNWREQADALAAALIENQSLDFLNVTEEGKTDSVAGVSINIYGFLNSVQGCLAQASGEAVKEAVALADGTYTANGEEYNGYADTMTMTVKDGKVVEVIWDALDADGNGKRVLSDNGEYVMTEDGLNWREQADALAAALIENQSLDFLNVTEEGKTDSVAGVSINIYGFINSVQSCLEQASGQTASEEVTTDNAAGTKIDAVSGATISSKAVVTGVNQAFDFVNQAK